MRMRIDMAEEAKFAMAPMIDMVFLLLVFFMTTSHLSQTQQKRGIEIPTATRGVVPLERPDRWIVNVDAEGRIYSGVHEIDLDELRTEVSTRLREVPETRVYLRADAMTPHREVKRVMNAMAEIGVDNFIFGVYTPSRGGS